MTQVSKLHTGSVRLVDRRTRVVEVLGPEPPGSRRPTDRELLFYRPQANLSEYLRGPESFGYCFHAEGRRAKFLIEDGKRGDALLDMLARHPEAPARPAQPWGIKGYVVRG